MEVNGGYATLGHLYQHVLKSATANWGTKTPFASMRRIVQDERFFFKIRPGLWALKGFENKLPSQIVALSKAATQRDSFGHSYYQGLLVEIGNLQNRLTAVPAQDKGRPYLGKKLEDVTTVESFYPFSYPHFVKRASTVDVVWFNERKMPTHFFEVEHSTDIQNSLTKFADLRDFYSKFRIVADRSREREYSKKLDYSVFKEIKSRIGFLSYDEVSDWHSRTAELVAIERKLSR